jgi:hypothetical protein
MVTLPWQASVSISGSAACAGRDKHASEREQDRCFHGPPSRRAIILHRAGSGFNAARRERGCGPARWLSSGGIEESGRVSCVTLLPPESRRITPQPA